MGVSPPGTLPPIRSLGALPSLPRPGGPLGNPPSILPPLSGQGPLGRVGEG